VVFLILQQMERKMNSNGSRDKTIKPPLRKNFLLFIIYLALISAAIYIPWHFFTVTGVPVTGSVVYADGKVRVFNNSFEKDRENAARLDEGDRVVTGKTEKTSISFEDLISIRLSHFTELEITKIRRQWCNPMDLLGGKRTNICAAGGTIILRKGAIWIDKSGGAPFAVYAGDTQIMAEKASFEVTYKPQGETCISVYRGDVRVGIVGGSDFNTVVFPGKECVMMNGRCTSINSLRYRSEDKWQNWNMALSYIAPPRSARKLAVVRVTAAGTQRGNGSKGGEGGTSKKGLGVKTEERTDPFSFKKWLSQKTREGKDPYPKYTPSGNSVSKLAFSEFPGTSAADETGNTDSGNSTGEDRSPETPPPLSGRSGAPAPAASLKNADRYSFERWVHDKTRGGKDPYPKYTPPSASGAATPEAVSELPYPSNSAQSTAQKVQKTAKPKAEDNSAESWFPFLKEDNVPPPPPSLNN